MEGSKEGDKVSIPLFSSFGLKGEWHERVVVTLSLVPGMSGLVWKPTTTTGDIVLKSDTLDAKEALKRDDVFRLRARHSSGNWVVGSVRMVGNYFSLEELPPFPFIIFLALNIHNHPPCLSFLFSFFFSAPWLSPTGRTT